MELKFIVLIFLIIRDTKVDIKQQQDINGDIRYENRRCSRISKSVYRGD